MSGLRRSRRRRGAALALLGGLVCGLGAGCGAGDAVLGVRDVPSATVSGAPLPEPAAADVVTRVLDEAAAGRTEALSGTALDLARAAERARTAPPPPQPSLSRPREPDVLAVSRGPAWPRTILAATTDPVGEVPTLHWLVSTGAAEPFTLAASVPLLPGASVPALGPVAGGAPALAPTERAGLAMAPRSALEAYAAALQRPRPRTTPGVATDDAFATALATAFTAQQKSLGALSTAKAEHAVGQDRTLALGLADGGALVVGRLDRTDTFTARPGARQLRVPESYVRLAGRATATRSITLTTLQPVVLVVPPGDGTVTAVAAGEQPAAAVAR